jgi:hypothetical protein
MGQSYPDAEQVVTKAFCTGIVPSYVAYFQVGGVQVTGSAGGIPLHDGDRVAASVTYLGIHPIHSGPYTYRRGRYRFAILDQTQGKHFQVTSSTDCLRSRCDHSTAEVSAGDQVAGSPLADYGKVSFSGIVIRDMRGRGGAFSSRAPWKVTKLIELSASTHKRAASPSRLNHGGTRFSDRWLAY